MYYNGNFLIEILLLRTKLNLLITKFSDLHPSLKNVYF